MESREIYITGFGKFVGHEDVNASWEAVKLLPDTLKIGSKVFKVNKLEVPVVYEEVDRFVEKIWKTNPILVIHCGVHGLTSKIQIECSSKSFGYCGQDYSGKCLENSDACLKNNTCSQLETTLPVEKIFNELNQKYRPNSFLEVSCDPGNYLCAYIYIKSLDLDTNRTLFLHVPPIDKMATLLTKEIIRQITQKCLQHLLDTGKY